MRGSLLALAVAVAAAVAYAEPGYTPQPAELHDRPAPDGKAVARLNTRESFEVLGRQAGWLQVKTAEASGWLPLGRVRTYARLQPGEELLHLLRQSAALHLPHFLQICRRLLETGDHLLAQSIHNFIGERAGRTAVPRCGHHAWQAQQYSQINLLLQMKFVA